VAETACLPGFTACLEDLALMDRDRVPRPPVAGPDDPDRLRGDRAPAKEKSRSSAPDWVTEAVLRRDSDPTPWQAALTAGDVAETWLGSVRILVEVLAGPGEAPGLPGDWRLVRAFSAYYPHGEVGTVAVSDITRTLAPAAFADARRALEER